MQRTQKLEKQALLARLTIAACISLGSVTAYFAMLVKILKYVKS